MGEAGGTREGEKCIQGFGGKTSSKEATWKTQVQMENLLKCRKVMGGIKLNSSGSGQRKDDRSC